MSFRLDINDKTYINGSRDLIKTEYDLSKDLVSLRGFYYGSGTCMDGSGCGWLVKVKSLVSSQENKVINIFSDHQKIKLKLYYHSQLVEEIDVEYPFFEIKDEIEVESKWIKKIYLRGLHRWGEPTPLEIAGVEIQKHPYIILK